MINRKRVDSLMKSVPRHFEPAEGGQDTIDEALAHQTERTGFEQSTASRAHSRPKRSAKRSRR